MLHVALMVGSGQQQYGMFSLLDSVKKSKEDTVCSIPVDLWKLSFHPPRLWKEETLQPSQQPNQHQGPGLALRPSDLNGAVEVQATASSVYPPSGRLLFT